MITALPLYHIFALTANLLVFMRLGARNVLIPNPRELKPSSWNSPARALLRSPA